MTSSDELGEMNGVTAGFGDGARLGGVSVIIPAYNGADYLTRGVESVLTGGYEDVEIIIVDDASSDATLEVARSLERRDSRVRAIGLPSNGGPSVARNRALREVRKEWVALLDCDDWWGEGRLQYLLKLGHTHRADIVSDDIFLINEGASRPWTTMSELHAWEQEEAHLLSADELCSRDWIPKPIFRTRWLREVGLLYDESLRSGEEDFVFFLQALLAGGRWVVGDRAFYFYLSRPGALTRTLQLGTALIASGERLRADPRIQNDPVLRRAFDARLNRIRNAQWRNELVQHVRKRRWGRAVVMMGGSPSRTVGLLRALRERQRIHRLQCARGKIAPA